MNGRGELLAARSHLTLTPEQLAAIEAGIKARSRKVRFGTGALQDDKQRARARNAKRLKSLPGARGTRGAGPGNTQKVQERSQEAKTKLPEPSGRPNKYRNVPVVVDNVRFASKREAKRYGELRLLEQAGEITLLELQPRYPLRIGAELICTYVADFAYSLAGKHVVEDVKGVRTDVYMIKKRLFHALYCIEIQET